MIAVLTDFFKEADGDLITNRLGVHFRLLDLNADMDPAALEQEPNAVLPISSMVVLL